MSEVGSPTTRHVALGTAGHIDHGKSTLVRRLTGVDMDRLPEERRRGITITLGFAPLTLPDGTRVGVVDVPGHEKLVRTMVAGAGGLDVVLLVVAADEGVMPQTREHLEICQLLGVPRALVALTKIDKAGPELTAMALDDVRAHLATTSLAGAPIVPCSALTGEGLDALRAALVQVVAEVQPGRRDTRPAALPIDRAFSVKGFGTVVTGTLRQGTLAPGDKVELVPGPIGEALRVRSVEVFRAPVTRAHAGDRTALSLHGVELSALSPGQVVAAPGTLRATRLVDVELLHLASRSKVLKTGAKVEVYAGTAAADATITLLDHDTLEPGERALARLRLSAPLGVLPGQRFILRGFDAATQAGRTVGGGRVLDPEPPRRKRHEPAALATLEALAAWGTLAAASAGPTPSSIDALATAALALLAERGARGLSRDTLARRLGAETASIEKLRGPLAIGELYVHPDALARLQVQVLAAVDAFHAEHPYRGAVPLAELASKLGRRTTAPVIERAARALVGMKKLAQDPEGYRRPDHASSAFAGGDARKLVLELLQQRGLEPPWVMDVAAETKLAEKALRELLAIMAKSNEVVRATSELYFARSAFDGGAAVLAEWFATKIDLSTQDAKNLLGLSRKYLIPLLESYDKLGVTVRVGEVRRAKGAKKVSS
jgi:selenocysteine-specific elongation factor